jgi:ATP-binding cassette subfamily B protein
MEQMDEILVMDAGKIVERGTHDQLLAMQGRYAALWKLGRSPEQVDVT